MSISLVQTKNTSSGGSSVASLSITLTLTAGNLVIISSVASPAVTASIADTDGNSFTLATAPAFPIVGVSASYNAWYVKNCNGGATTITVTFSGSTPYTSIVVSEFSGASASAPFDTGSWLYQAPAASGTDYPSGSFTATENGELIYAFSNVYAGGGSPPASGYTSLFQDTGTGAGAAYRINATAGVTSGAMNSGSGGGGFDVLGLAFKPASSPPPTNTQRGCIAFDQIKGADRTGNGDQLLTWTSPAPAHSTSTGAANQIAYDSAGNFYWCYAANSWARIGPGGYSASW